jgi:DNA polymerase-1
VKRLIVVDVSNFIFRAFFAIRMLNSPDGTPVNAVHGVLSMLMKLLSTYRPTHILLARDTAGGSFRNELYDEYKANRSEPPEDLVPQFALIKELIDKMGLPNSADDNYEADDIIGSACTQWKNDFDEILIASGDKDLMQFVDGNVKMLDTMKDKIYDEKGVFEKMGVWPKQIVDYLSMVGDSSDNIPGMKGIGAKGAAKLLAEHDTLENCIELKDTFKGKKLINAFTNHVDDALLSKKLIQIVTDIDLGLSAEESSYQFYPSDELLTYLKGLGFSSVIKKLEDIRKQVDLADEDVGFVNLNAENHGLVFDTHKVDSASDLSAIKDKLASAKTLGLYTFFNSDDIINRQAGYLSVSFDENEAFVLTDESLINELLSAAFAREGLVIINDKIKENLKYALVHDFEIKCSFFDVSQAHYNISPFGRHNIENISDQYLGATLEVIKKSKEEIPYEVYEKFVTERSIALSKLYSALKDGLGEQELENVYFDMDNPLQLVLAKMEREGIAINTQMFETFEKELETHLAQIQDDIYKEADVEDVNLNSPKQVGELLFEKLQLPVVKKTKTGYSTDVEVLEKLSASGASPIPEMLLKFREVGKLLSTYVKAIPQLKNEKTGKVHTVFHQNVAQTGRLSSTHPNLQNIPVRSELGRKVRKGFIADKGNVLLAFDYSQVELRLLAHFSEDPTMVQAFNDDQDIHAQTASEVLGVALSDVTSNDRSKAKAVNFGLMYGQSSFGLASALKISRKEAKEYITKYFERFSKVKVYLDTLKTDCEKNGYAITLHGRKRFLPDIHSKNRTIRSMAERMAINSPIQGTAADIIKLAMIDIDKEMIAKGLKSKMLLQVHDELIFDVPEDEIAVMKELVVRCMEGVVDLKVPLKVDMGMGVNWLDLKS